MSPGTLDYHKLRYFWVAARRGSLAAAARAIGVSQPTVSTQVQSLEEQLGGLLFERRGRRLALTDLGKRVLQNAEQIFELGAELERFVSEGDAGSPTELLVGVSDGIPKPVVGVLLKPFLQSVREERAVCREWRTDILLAELAQHRLDLVISEIGGEGALPSQLLCYEAGSSAMILLATTALASRARARFPKSLTGMPFLLPVRESPLRRSMDAWFDANNVAPQVVAEIEDRALLHNLGREGLGVFPAALLLEKELCRRYQVVRTGVLKGVRERYFVVTTSRGLRHPAVANVCAMARRQFMAATAKAAGPLGK